MKGVLQDYLVTDEVVASTAQTMEDTLRFLDTRYGGIKRYLQLIGITRSEVRPACVRSALFPSFISIREDDQGRKEGTALTACDSKRPEVAA